MTKEEATKFLQDYITQFGYPASSWYVGITDDPKRRLFQEHSVHEKLDRWAHTSVTHHLDARNIERYFIELLGTDGGSGGGDINTVHVYCFLKTQGTTR